MWLRMEKARQERDTSETRVAMTGRGHRLAELRGAVCLSLRETGVALTTGGLWLLLFPAEMMRVDMGTF